MAARQSFRSGRDWRILAMIAAAVTGAGLVFWSSRPVREEEPAGIDRTGPEWQKMRLDLLARCVPQARDTRASNPSACACFSSLMVARLSPENAAAFNATGAFDGSSLPVADNVAGVCMVQRFYRSGGR